MNAGPTQRSEGRLAEVAALTQQMPPGEGAIALGELHRTNKRLNSIIGVVPVIGWIRLRNSTEHTAGEKNTLIGMSLLLTLLAVGAVWSTIPTTRETEHAMHQRVVEEIATLGGLLETYRGQQGHYPSREDWDYSVTHADRRFFDPWGHPYLFAPDGSGFTISSLGADGAIGGSGEDADVSQHFSATSASSVPLPR